MKTNLIALIRAGADALDEGEDPGGRAYALHNVANNLILVLEGKATAEDLRLLYTTGGAELLDLDKRFPCE